MAKRRVVEPEGKVDLTAPASVEERVAALEATVSALVFSTFGARGSDGKLLQRCACGVFATRRVAIVHPVAGTHYESLCADCSPRSPLATEGVPRDEQELLSPADRAHVDRMNRGLNQARLWGGS